MNKRFIMHPPFSLRNKTFPVLLMPRVGKITYLHEKSCIFSHRLVCWTDIYIYNSSIIIFDLSGPSITERGM